MRDETKNATEVEMSIGNIKRTASKVDAGTHLSEQEVVTDELWKNKANTLEIARIKIGSKKIVFAQQAKEKMVFSKESSPAFARNGQCGAD